MGLSKFLGCGFAYLASISYGARLETEDELTAQGEEKEESQFDLNSTGGGGVNESEYTRWKKRNHGKKHGRIRKIEYTVVSIQNIPSYDATTDVKDTNLCWGLINTKTFSSTTPTLIPGIGVVPCSEDTVLQLREPGEAITKMKDYRYYEVHDVKTKRCVKVSYNTQFSSDLVVLTMVPKSQSEGAYGSGECAMFRYSSLSKRFLWVKPTASGMIDGTDDFNVGDVTLYENGLGNQKVFMLIINAHTRTTDHGRVFDINVESIEAGKLKRKKFKLVNDSEKIKPKIFEQI